MTSPDREPSPPPGPQGPPFVGGMQTNFDNPRELVLFILSHVPKHATIDLDRYLPE